MHDILRITFTLIFSLRRSDRGIECYQSVAIRGQTQYIVFIGAHYKHVRIHGECWSTYIVVLYLVNSECS